MKDGVVFDFRALPLHQPSPDLEVRSKLFPEDGNTVGAVESAVIVAEHRWVVAFEGNYFGIYPAASLNIALEPLTKGEVCILFFFRA